MTTREALHRLVDELPDDQAELARVWLADLHDAPDAGGPPLDAVALASLDRGLADIAEGRTKPLEEYEQRTVSYRVILAHEAEKILDHLDRPTERRISARFVQLAEDPFDPRLSGVLTERAGVRKSLVGGWRILFMVDREAKVLNVVTVDVCGGKALRVSVNSRSLAVTRLPSAMMTARRTRFGSSRTFPGQRCQCG